MSALTDFVRQIKELERQVEDQKLRAANRFFDGVDTEEAITVHRCNGALQILDELQRQLAIKDPETPDWTKEFLSRSIGLNMRRLPPRRATSITAAGAQEHGGRLLRRRA